MALYVSVRDSIKIRCTRNRAKFFLSRGDHYEKRRERFWYLQPFQILYHLAKCKNFQADFVVRISTCLMPESLATKQCSKLHFFIGAIWVICFGFGGNLFLIGTQVHQRASSGEFGTRCRQGIMQCFPSNALCMRI